MTPRPKTFSRALEAVIRTFATLPLDDLTQLPGAVAVAITKRAMFPDIEKVTLEDGMKEEGYQTYILKFEPKNSLEPEDIKRKIENTIPRNAFSPLGGEMADFKTRMTRLVSSYGIPVADIDIFPMGRHCMQITFIKKSDEAKELKPKLEAGVEAMNAELAQYRDEVQTAATR